MTNEDPSAAAAGGGRSPRQGSGGSPVGSTLSIVLAIVAVVAGFLILNNITDDGGSGGGSSAGVDEPATPGAVTTTTTAFEITTTVPVTTTTIVERVTEGATVVIANGNTVGGSAGRMTKTLETVGYTMGTPVNATVTIDDSIVYYDASVTSAQAVAESVARDMGCVDVETAPTPPPTEDGTLGDGNVLVVLGNDQADKTIEEMTAEGCETEQATGEAPAPSGSEDVVAPTTTAGEEGEEGEEG